MGLSRAQSLAVGGQHFHPEQVPCGPGAVGSCCSADSWCCCRAGGTPPGHPSPGPGRLVNPSRAMPGTPGSSAAGVRDGRWEGWGKGQARGSCKWEVPKDFLPDPGRGLQLGGGQKQGGQVLVGMTVPTRPSMVSRAWQSASVATTAQTWLSTCPLRSMMRCFSGHSSGPSPPASLAGTPPGRCPPPTIPACAPPMPGPAPGPTPPTSQLWPEAAGAGCGRSWPLTMCTSP